MVCFSALLCVPLFSLPPSPFIQDTYLPRPGAPISVGGSEEEEEDEEAGGGEDEGAHEDLDGNRGSQGHSADDAAALDSMVSL